MRINTTITITITGPRPPRRLSSIDLSLSLSRCVKQLGKGDTGDFLVAAPYAIQLFSDHDDGTGGEEKTAAVATTAAAVATVTGAAAAAEGIGKGKGKGERGKVAKLLCEDGKKLFKAYEVCEEGALECDAAAAEAAVRAIAFAKSLSTSTSSSTQTSETAVTAAGAGAAATTATTTTAATTKTLEADTAPPLVFVRIKVRTFDDDKWSTGSYSLLSIHRFLSSVCVCLSSRLCCKCVCGVTFFSLLLGLFVLLLTTTTTTTGGGGGQAMQWSANVSQRHVGRRKTGEEAVKMVLG
jgi:hypothetical protein